MSRSPQFSVGYGAIWLVALLVIACERVPSEDDDMTDDDTTDQDDDTGDDDTAGDDDSQDDDDTTPPCQIMGCGDLPPIESNGLLAFSDIDCEEGISHSYYCVTTNWTQTTFTIRNQKDLEASLWHPKSCSVDFDTHMVVGAQGYDPMDKGDFVDICEVHQLDDRILVRYYWYAWSPSKGMAELVCPHHFVSIERSGQPVEFEQFLCVDHGD